MPAWSWIVIAAAVVIVVAMAVIVARSVNRRKRSQRLKNHFGPEYERAVGEAGDGRRRRKGSSLRANESDKSSTSSHWRRKHTQSVQNAGGRCRLRSSTIRPGRWATPIVS